MTNRAPSISLLLTIFGVITVAKGGHVIFTESGRIGAGDYVPFILWFNFLSGFLYILAGTALFRKKIYGGKLAKFIALSSFLVFVLLIIHILEGQPYEIRTVAAMSFRTAVWVLAAIFIFKKRYFYSHITAC